MKMTPATAKKLWGLRGKSMSLHNIEQTAAIVASIAEPDQRAIFITALPYLSSMASIQVFKEIKALADSELVPPSGAV